MNRKLVILAVVSAVAGCGPQMSPTPDGGMPMSAHYAIELKAAHAHIYKKVAQVFTVYDLDSCTNMNDRATCTKVPKLPVVAFYRLPGSADLVEQQLEAGKLEDVGDGTYVYYSEFSAFGWHLLGMKFSIDSQTVFTAFPFETTRGGGEKFFCDTTGDTAPDLVHQVRWDAAGGNLTVGKEVVFSVELMRSFNTPLNTAQPYKNSFDHLNPSSLTVAPAIKLMADQGAAAKEIATLTPEYKGKGLYQVKYTFTAADLATVAERTFWLDIRYTDSLACVIQSADSEADYHFPVKRSL